MATQRKKKITVSILVPFLVFFIFFTIMLWQKYRSSRDVPQVIQVEPGSPVAGSRQVTLFFVAGGTSLARETREIEQCEEAAVCLKSVLDELLNGSVGELEEALPAGTAVETVRIDGNQAVIDLNATFAEAMVSGSSAEMMAVYSLVNSAALNFPNIQNVKLNVAGDTHKVLHHLDLSEPLAPDYSLEQQSNAGIVKPVTTPIKTNKGTVQ
jgi:hypothetical protein